VPETDTIKKVGYDKSVRTTLDRSGVWRIQTPQAFRFELIKKAYEKAFMDKFYATDDAMLVERLGEKVKIVKGSYNNIKITTREDLVVAETMLSKTKDGLFGIGYDIHRLSENRRLMLGGVRIPFKKGLMGHSDGDALLHSICDAMLGSTGEKDIGNHFPNTDKRYRGISSLILLQKVEKILEGRGYIVKNIDCVVIAESPKIAPYADRMKTKIAEVLKIRKENIGIKATTNEGIGFIGEGGGIAAFSIVSVVKG